MQKNTAVLFMPVLLLYLYITLSLVDNGAGKEGIYRDDRAARRLFLMKTNNYHGLIQVKCHYLISVISGNGGQIGS
ncbi:hypothetical protein CBW52_12545 [Yersinia kristensenii]|uniref:Uncharacterized protein n=2 Tax=Yersinia kristensenii TaxID=28152 RepID=A0AB73NJ75_YERKR|nr:hypothetical protein CBW52_12545 [Yersinia kristensenii]